jgi:hypothetical protein
MSEMTRPEDGRAAQPEDLETYEPPVVVVLGSLPELTGGGFTGGVDPIGASGD